MTDDRITIIVGRDIKSQVKLYCAKNHINMTEYLTSLISKDLAKN